MPSLKQIPPCPAAPPHLSSGLMIRDYQISLITPLFGGGVEAGVNDPTMPIRGTAIRGQLQFWWRATRGAAFADVKAMRARHAEVWGTTDRASPVVVEVRDVKVDPSCPCAEHRHDPQMGHGQGGYRIRWLPPFAQTELPYALFPFQGKLPKGSKPGAPSEKQPASCILKGSFNLHIQFPSALIPDVEAAVWAWVNFGGLGARTRRGCGALWCKEFAPGNIEEIRGWLEGKQAAYGLVPPTTLLPWPTLPRAFLYRPEALDPIAIWSKLMALWKDFRQGEDFARDEGKQPNHPGRSRYPEPETIRETTGDRSPKHPRQDIPGREIPADAFPRAELGMPIVFEIRGAGEPPKTTLYPVENGERRNRMASSLILKPLTLVNGQAVRIIVPLVTSGVSKVELTKWDDVARQEVSLGTWGLNAIRDPRLATYPKSPLARSVNGSALEAFLALAQVPISSDGPGYEETT